MADEPEIRIVGAEVEVRKAGEKLLSAPLERVVGAIDRAARDESSFQVRPRGARIWEERGNTVALAIEMPPHARSVRWLDDDSPAPFGKRAKYQTYFLSFPWVVILLVMRGGALTGQQQLYYRTESLDTGDDLLLPNLYNVAQGYGLDCWLCLQHAPDVSQLSWTEKVSSVIDHTFSAAFNKSSEEHEGNSYWGPAQCPDPRVASVAQWQQATRTDRRVALDIPWKPAGTTASAELRSMLDNVVRPRKLRTATELAGLIAATNRRISKK